MWQNSLISGILLYFPAENDPIKSNSITVSEVDCDLQLWPFLNVFVFV